MNATEQTIVQPIASSNWWLRASYLSESDSDFEAIHVLIGQFLADRHSPNPLPETSLLAENAKFEWGYGKPLEKVIQSQADLAFLM